MGCDVGSPSDDRSTKAEEAVETAVEEPPFAATVIEVHLSELDEKLPDEDLSPMQRDRVLLDVPGDPCDHWQVLSGETTIVLRSGEARGPIDVSSLDAGQKTSYPITGLIYASCPSIGVPPMRIVFWEED